MMHKISSQSASRNTTTWGVLAAAVFLLANAGCEGPLTESQANGPATSLPVQTIAVSMTQDTPRTVVCFGKIVPQQQASLSFGQGGIVSQVLKATGQTVAAGEVLATVDQQKIIAQRQSVQQAIEQAEADAERLPAAQAPQANRQLATLRQQQNSLDLEIRKGQLVAPFAGSLVRSNIEVGSPVSPTMTALIVASDDSPNVIAYLDEDSTAAIRPDQVFWVGVNDTAFRTKLSDHSPAMGQAGIQQLKFEFEQPLSVTQWSYDEVVEIRFRLATSDSGYWLPGSALHQTASGEWAVFVATPSLLPESTGNLNQQDSAITDASDNAVVVQRIGRIVRQDGDQALVDDVELDGELVIVNGSHRIVPGQVVRAMAESTVLDSAKVDDERAAMEDEQ